MKEKGCCTAKYMIVVAVIQIKHKWLIRNTTTNIAWDKIEVLVVYRDGTWLKYLKDEKTKNDLQQENKIISHYIIL